VAFAALVVGVALWPPVHRLLVLRWDLDPWKLGGFAMDATWHGSAVALFEPQAGGLHLVDETTLGPEARRALATFRARRRTLGRWADPDEAVRHIHADRPDLEHLVLVIQRLWIDPDTGRLASEREILPYRRGEPVGGAGPRGPP